MRVSIGPQYSMQGLSYALRLGEMETRFRRSSDWRSHSEWTGEWIDGRPLQVRLPSFSAFETPRYSVLLDGESICEGALTAGFFSGYRVAWTFRDEPLHCRVRYGWKAGLSLRTDDGSLLAIWRFRRCSMHGAVRSSATSELAAAAVGIAFSTLVVKEDVA